ncbi:MAG: hypothetical protein MUP22_10035 [Desulfobacterales bacterium]|nr:hypothetical protein [Desulfobacterales bacterium]
MEALPQNVAETDRAILEFIKRGIDNDDEILFNQLALKTFALQYQYSDLYQRFCRRRGKTPETVTSWEEIPAIPTDVFKTAQLNLFPELSQRTFVTSGTSNPDEKGAVSYDSGGLALMDATIRIAAGEFLFPDKIKPCLLILAPPPESAPHMIMVYGMNRLTEYFGRSDSRFLVGPDGFDVQDLIHALEHSEKKGIPVAICGGSFGFVNFFDFCKKIGRTFRLPPGSRCLDAGGFKGRSRELDREEFLGHCEDYLGIAAAWCVNLLGMTETASQFYDNCLLNFLHGLSASRVKINPPWTRTIVVDPDTLEPLPKGQTGLLRHFDLANRGHVCAIQSDDMGRLVGDGFEIDGRASSGEARGCALTIDELTRLQEDG